MLEETLFSLDLPYRQPMAVKAFSFGVDENGRLLGGSSKKADAPNRAVSRGNADVFDDDAAIESSAKDSNAHADSQAAVPGEEPESQPADPAGFEKSACFVAGLRGNELQQTFICSQLVRRLQSIERDGGLVPRKRITVVPCVNPASMNTGQRFWLSDGTDVNRMMPGYDLGETTQRIAGALFEAVRGYECGVHFSSYHLDGDFMDHVRVMSGPGNQDNHGSDFGLPYVLQHVPGSFDTTTLHYNWRLWDTEAYTIYTRHTSVVDQAVAANATRACLRFLNERGMVDYPGHRGFRATQFAERQLAPAQSPCGGIFLPQAGLGDIVHHGQHIADVVDPLTGEVRARIFAPRGGVVFYVCRAPLVNEQTLVFQIIPRDVSMEGETETARGNFLDPEA